MSLINRTPTRDDAIARAHAYFDDGQFVADLHLLAPIAREGLGMMAGLFWDLGEGDTPYRR